MGGETDGTQRQLLTSNLGVLQTLDSEVFGKTSQIANQTTLSNTNEATLIANQTNGTQIAKIQGVDSNTLISRDCKQNANGDLRVQLIANDGNDGGGQMRIVGCNSNGFLKVKDDELETNYVAGAFTTQLAARTTIGDTTTRKNLLCDANGVLQVNDISGGGGGGSASSTATSNTIAVADNTMTTFGNGLGQNYIDTNGGNKMIISVNGASAAGSPAVNIEWSNDNTFPTGHILVSNGMLGLNITTPLTAFNPVARLDATTLGSQMLIIYDYIPQRFCRITLKHTAGSPLTFNVKSYLSP